MEIAMARNHDSPAFRGQNIRHSKVIDQKADDEELRSWDIEVIVEDVVYCFRQGPHSIWDTLLGLCWKFTQDFHTNVLVGPSQKL